MRKRSKRLSRGLLRELRYQLDGSRELWQTMEQERPEVCAEHLARIRRIRKAGGRARTSDIAELFVAEDKYFRYDDDVVAELEDLLRRIRGHRRPKVSRGPRRLERHGQLVLISELRHERTVNHG